MGGLLGLDHDRLGGGISVGWRGAGAFHPTEAYAGQGLGGEPAPSLWGAYRLALLIEREGSQS